MPYVENLREEILQAPNPMSENGSLRTSITNARCNQESTIVTASKIIQFLDGTTPTEKENEPLCCLRQEAELMKWRSEDLAHMIDKIAALLGME